MGKRGKNVARLVEGNRRRAAEQAAARELAEAAKPPSPPPPVLPTHRESAAESKKKAGRPRKPRPEIAAPQAVDIEELQMLRAQRKMEIYLNKQKLKTEYVARINHKIELKKRLIQEAREKLEDVLINYYEPVKRGLIPVRSVEPTETADYLKSSIAGLQWHCRRLEKERRLAERSMDEQPVIDGEPLVTGRIPKVPTGGRPARARQPQPSGALKKRPIGAPMKTLRRGSLYWTWRFLVRGEPNMYNVRRYLRLRGLKREHFGKHRAWMNAVAKNVKGTCGSITEKRCKPWGNREYGLRVKKRWSV